MGVDPQSDHHPQSGEVDQPSSLHPSLQEKTHPREQSDDPHLGIVPGKGKSQKGRRRHIRHSAPHRRPAPDLDFAQVDVYTPAGEKHGQDVAPAQMPLKGGEKVDEVGRKILGSNLFGLRKTAHLRIPHRLRQRLYLLPYGQLCSLVEILTDIPSVDDLVGKEEFGEVNQTQQRKDSSRKPGSLPYLRSGIHPLFCLYRTIFRRLSLRHNASSTQG